MKSALLSLVSGAVLGFTGVILHNFVPPLGLITAIVVSVLGINLVGQKFGTRTAKVIALAAWMAVLFRAGIRGTSYELIIYGNAIGNIYLITSVIAVIITALRKVR